MKKKIITVILISLIVLSFSINVFSVVEENNNEVKNSNNNSANLENKTLEEQKKEVSSKIEVSNNKLEYVQTEMSATLQKVMELQDNKEKYETQYNNLQSQISTLSNQIQEMNKKLQDIQEKYDKKEKTLKKKVVALYESGDTTYLDLLLSSRNIVEFLSNYFLVSELIEYDNNLLDEMEDTQNQIKNTKQQQERQEDELRSTREEIEKTQILIENTRVIQQNYAMKLTDTEKKIQEEIEKYKEEQANIEREIALALNWAGTFAIQATNGAMIWPIAMDGTFVTSPYGVRLHPIQGIYKKHDGLDISASGVYGAPIVAAADGMVIFAGVMGGYGNCVMISHGNGLSSLYGHGSEIVAQIGQTVKQGDVIMKVGSTGNSTGPHLHFELRKDGVVIDPVPYFNGEIKTLDGQNEIKNENTHLDNSNNLQN